MRIHVTRTRVLGAMIAIGLVTVLAQGAFAVLGIPAHAAEAAVAVETQARGFVRQFGRGGPGVGGLPPLWMLDLSEGQQAQIDRVREAAREASASVRGQMREARQGLNEAIRSEVVDEGRIRALVSTISTLEADALIRQAYVYADVWQILTPAQQDDVQAMDQRRAEQRERRIERFRRQ